MRGDSVHHCQVLLVELPLGHLERQAAFRFPAPGEDHQPAHCLIQPMHRPDAGRFVAQFRPN